MKRLSKIYALLLVCTQILCSCHDFLNEAPRGSTIASTVDDCNKMLNASQNFNLQMFGQYYAIWKSPEFEFTSGSIATISSAYQNSKSIEAALKYEDKVYREDEVTMEWTALFNRIYMLNSILKVIDNAEGNNIDRKYIKAEARMQRAYYHFILAQWYTMPYNEQTASTEPGLPIVTTADTQQMSFPQVSVKELYDWILSEMEDSCPNLNPRDVHKMRCYMATGYSMLGKVYFIMNKYDKAREALAIAYDLSKNSKSTFFTNYADNNAMKSAGYGELSVMNMFAGIWPKNYYYRDNEALYCVGYSDMKAYYPAYYGMEPADYIKTEVYALYDEHDLRRNMIATKDYLGTPYVLPTATFLGNDINIGITLQELYLMLAECEARVGSESKARQLLTELRGYRMLPGYQEIPSSIVTKVQLIRFCIEEETREFVGSGYLFYNLRRLWSEPLCQDWKPITHKVDGIVYTMKESNLKHEIPHTVLSWNLEWR